MLFILTYHSVNILGNDYATNDHVALAEDLVVLSRLGARVLPLGKALEVVAKSPAVEQPLVAVTFDDGAVFDYEDVDHPTCGPQKSFFRILDEFRREYPASQPELHASSFVIVSPEARQQLDEIDFGSRGWWHDRWWLPAKQSGLLAVENHSWDHNHPSLPDTVEKSGRTGDFWTIDTEAEADLEIRQAAEYLHRSGIQSRYFAYPWGHANDYLRTSYLPRFGPAMGLEAALGTKPEPVTQGSDRWDLPRWVCGKDWTSPEELAKIIRSAG